LRRGLWPVVAAGGALGAYAAFEAQWLEFRVLDVPVAGLPPALDGFRIAHLSDFHLGTLSQNARTLGKAADWIAERRPDLVAITGDLVSRPGGRGELDRFLRRIDGPYGVYAVLGNHDVEEARDPFSRPTDLLDIRDAGAVLLRDDERAFDVRGVRLQVVGIDPATYTAGRSHPAERADPDAAFRVLLSHYPHVVDLLPAGTFQLVLAGHLHGGQICMPTPWGKLRLEHLRAPYWEGVFERPGGVLHVSRGLGTSFVPFRLLARPEATELVLRGGPR
jgi:predicted MPP superfamily phosphohydrolase